MLTKVLQSLPHRPGPVKLSHRLECCQAILQPWALQGQRWLLWSKHLTWELGTERARVVTFSEPHGVAGPPSPKPPAPFSNQPLPRTCLTYHGSPAPRGEFPEPRVPQTAACMLAQDTRCPDFDKPLPLQAPTTHIQGTPLFNPGVAIREPVPKPDWSSKLPQQPIQRSTNSQFCPRGQWAHFSQSHILKGCSLV